MRSIQHCVEYLKIIGNRQYRFHIIWDWTKCYSAPKYRMLGDRQVWVFFKPLTYLWNTCCRPLPINTLLIDDAPYKSCMNPPGNGIFVDTFDGYLEEGFFNEVLCPYVFSLKDVPNIPCYIESDRLGQEPLNNTCDYKDSIQHSDPLFPLCKLSNSPLMVFAMRSMTLERTSTMEKYVEKIDFVTVQQKSLSYMYHSNNKKSRGVLFSTFILLDLYSSNITPILGEKDMRLFLKALVQKLCWDSSVV